MKYRYVYALIILLSFSACKKFSEYKERHKLAVEIRKLYNQEIIMPDSLIIVYENTISILDKTYFTKNQNFKIIILINGGCNSCVLDMKKWIGLLNDSFEKYAENTFFVVNIPSMEFRNNDLSLLNYFPYPLIIDTMNLFIETNNLPKDQRFHTMLLNKLNKIVLLGDPTANHALEELYMSKIESLQNDD